VADASLELHRQVSTIVNGTGTVEERDARLGELLDAQPTEELKNIVREGSASLHELASVPQDAPADLFSRLHGN